MRSLLIRKTVFISSRTISINCTHPETHSLIKISHFSASPSHFNSAYSSRRHEDESRLVRVSVWWDFENCALPKGNYAYKVAHCITSAVRANGIKGPIQITAFGDVMQLSRPTQEILSATGINITHVPNGGKNSADRSLLVDLMYWVSQNPPPAHLFLISGDRDFANILHRLRLNNYNILLSSPDSAPGVLCSAASIMWQWNALVKGEDLNGKHFNQPPDGPYGSWYGHYRLPLEDPFAVTEQSARSQLGDSSESGSEDTLRPVPKEVVKQLQRILNLYPDGIAISDLRQELNKSDVNLDRDLYGYQKFLRFLSSMPHIVKIKALGDGQFSIQKVASKCCHSADDNPSTTSNRVSSNEDINQTVSAKRFGGDSLCAGPEEKSSVPSSPKVHVQEPLGNLPAPTIHLEEPLKSVSDPSPEKANSAEVSTNHLKKFPESPKHVEIPLEKVPDNPLKKLPEKANSAEVSTNHLKKFPESPKHVEIPLEKVPDNPLPVETVNSGEVTNSHPCSEEQDPVPEVSFFRRIWRKWVGAKDSGPIENDSKKLDTCATSNDSTMKTEEADSNFVESSGACNDPVGVVENLSSADESITDENVTRKWEANDRSSRPPGFFNQIVSWCKFWRSQEQSDPIELSNAENLIRGDNNEDHHLFSTESFWNEMVAFINTSKGSDVIKRSMTRVEMSRNLQNQGPPVVRDLIESDLLHLVDLLISDKKWVEECLSEKYPFKLIRSGDKGSSSSSPTSKGLNSILLDTHSLPVSQSRQKKKEKGYQNLPHARDSSPTIHMNLNKSRSEVVADCRNLLEFIVKNYPQGFSIGKFRKMFLEKYGYSLEVQKFGYNRLVSLVQTMPGVKIESAIIMPDAPYDIDLKSWGIEVTDPSVSKINGGDVKSKFGADISDTSKTSNQLDSSWEELGPITDTTPKRQKMGTSSKKKKETAGQVNHNYETLSADYLSGSDEESFSSTAIDGHKHSRKQGQDSSLLQILDSWYQNKDDTRGSKDCTRAVADKVGAVDNCSKKDSIPSLSAGSLQNEDHVSREQKLRLSKSYSFVSDEAVDDKDKLIDGILGSLKKPGGRSAEPGL